MMLPSACFSVGMGLFIVNLFNILLNLIYHYFMKDLQGPRGLKGEIGERGLPGQDDKCGCKIRGVVTTHTTGSDGFDIDDADKIESKTVSVGTSGAGADFEIPDLAHILGILVIKVV